VDELGKELQKRNVYSTVPIFILYEWKMAWNMCLIDTPALVPGSKHFLGEDEEDTDTDRDDEPTAGSTAAAGEAEAGASPAPAASAGSKVGSEPPSPAKAPPSNDGSVVLGGDKGDDAGDSGTESLKGRKRGKGQSEDKKSARMQQAILELITPAERFIVAVEEASTPTYVMPRVVQNVDPKYHRTVFVYTKFHVRPMTPISSLAPASHASC
jgi:hypothetical protein